MRALPVVASLSCVGACSVGWYGFNSLQPKNLREYLEWQGFKLVSASEDSTWNAILVEKDKVAKKVVGSEVNKEELKKWCTSRMELEKFNEYIQDSIDLCIHNIKTVKGKLVQDNKDLKLFLTNEEDGNDDKWRVSYAFRKHNQDFLDLIGHTPEEKESEWEPAVGKYKRWCRDSLVSELKGSVYESFLVFCMPKNFSTVRKYLEGRELLIDVKYEKELKQLHEKIGKMDSYTADNIEKGMDGLKKWCNSELDKNFKDGLNILDEILPKVISRCVKDSQVTDK